MLLFALMWLGVACLLVFLLTEGRRGVERKAEADVMSIASLVDAQLAGSLRHLQSDLAQLALLLPRESFRHSAASASHNAAVAAELAASLRSMPDVVGLHVLDVRGDLIHSVGNGEMALGRLDRAQFVHRVAANGGKLYISDPELDQVSGALLLPLALATRDSTGELLGVIVAPLNLNGAAETLAKFDLASAGVMVLRHLESGHLVLSRPALPQSVRRYAANDVIQARMAAGQRQGTLRSASPLDGVERTYGFLQIGDFPIYLTVGLATGDYLAEWRQTLVVSLTAVALLFLVMLWLMIRMLRAERIEARTASRLAESEARYRMLAENSHDVIWTLDIPSRTISYVSPSVFGMCGYRQEELLGKGIGACLTVASAEIFSGEVDLRLRRMAAGDPDAAVQLIELEQVCKDGRVISTEVVLRYLDDEDGVPKTILGITRNVSERKAADLALRETNRQLQFRIDEIGRLQSALQELAVRDSLTGLYNRRYLDETLEREVSRARREGVALSLVMLDIDHFKRINDTYGHQVGDEALRLLAKSLLADVRAEDMVCRYGGEEFLILLPSMPLEAALVRAEVWREGVASLSLALGTLQIGITISLGVSAYPEHGKSPDDLTRCADQALYQAKREGRNRVVVHAI